MFWQKLIRLCGEVLATPTENEEIQFLCIVCAKLKQDPYLVNFFLEVCHTSRTRSSLWKLKWNPQEHFRPARSAYQSSFHLKSMFIPTWNHPGRRISRNAVEPDRRCAGEWGKGSRCRGGQAVHNLQLPSACFAFGWLQYFVLFL